MTKTTMADVKRELEEEIRNCRKEMEAQILELKKSVQFFSDEFDKNKNELGAIKAENKKLRDENQSLKSKCELLTAQVTGAEYRIRDCEQYSRNANVEIKGVPICQEESLPELMAKIGDKIGEPISASDIEICHRVPVPKNASQQNIVVQFARRTKRDVFFDKARKSKIIGTDLGFDGANPVFVNEHLCPELKRLLGQAVSRKREVGWRFVWVRNGHILARRAENTPVLRIAHASDVARMT